MTEPPELLDSGRFVLKSEIGSGAQGRTFLALDKSDGSEVCVKRFLVRGARRWKDVELAEREASVLADLQHRALPRYVHSFEEEGALYVVMERVEGRSLLARRTAGELFSTSEAWRFLEEMSGVLDYLHQRSQPIVHRDIKPSNVIQRPDGTFALVDFGSVRDRLRTTGGSTVAGTFGYMAPEQLHGRAGPGADVYAVGATLLAMLTGREPEDLPHRGLAIDVARAVGRDGDARLVRVLRRMLEPEPERRAARIEPLLRPAAVRAWPRRALVLAGVALLGAPALFALRPAALFALRPTATNTTTAAATAAPPATARKVTNKVYKVGDTGSALDYELTVSDVKECKNKYYFSKPENGNMWIGVKVLVASTTDKPFFANPGNAEIIDGNGIAYNPSYEVTKDCDPGLKGTSLAKGEKARGWIVFEIPKKSASLELSYNPSFFGESQTIRFDLGR